MRKGKKAQYCRKESAERLTKEESKEKLSAKEGRGGGRGEESLEHFRTLWRSGKSYIKSLTKIFRNPLPTVNK